MNVSTRDFFSWLSLFVIVAFKCCYIKSIRIMLLPSCQINTDSYQGPTQDRNLFELDQKVKLS